MVEVYVSLVRSIVEYASVVFANLPRYLSKSVEEVQQRTSAIIFPRATSC